MKYWKIEFLDGGRARVKYVQAMKVHTAVFRALRFMEDDTRRVMNIRVIPISESVYKKYYEDRQVCRGGL